MEGLLGYCYISLVPSMIIEKRRIKGTDYCVFSNETKEGWKWLWRTLIYGEVRPCSVTEEDQEIHHSEKFVA
jgi:hypothetical protein